MPQVPRFGRMPRWVGLAAQKLKITRSSIQPAAVAYLKTKVRLVSCVARFALVLEQWIASSGRSTESLTDNRLQQYAYPELA